MNALIVRVVVAVATFAVFCACDENAPLPSVDSVLTKASSKAQDFAQQAAAMQQKLNAQREQSRATLHTQKQEYELLLQAQSNHSEAISRQNRELQVGNDKLAQRNTELTAQLKNLSEKNGQMRATLQTIDAKVAAAQLFLVDSLKMTDDSDAKELDVMIPSTPKPTLDHFLAVTGGKALSLLAVRTRDASGPESIVSMLSDSLAEIAEAEKEGAAELKAHFLESYSAAEKHQLELNDTQAVLLKTQSDLKEQRTKLMEAKDHLEATGKELHERLRAVNAFASNVDSVVVSSLHDNMAAKASTQPAKANLSLEFKAPSPASPASGNRVLSSSNLTALVNVSLLATHTTFKKTLNSSSMYEPQGSAAAKGSSLRTAVVKNAQRDSVNLMGRVFEIR